MEELDVSMAIIETFGAVSIACVWAMAQGALTHSNADVAVAISGVAGPDGGSPEKPVGTVWFAWVKATGETKTELKSFGGDRAAVQEQSVIFALQGLINHL